MTTRDFLDGTLPGLRPRLPRAPGWQHQQRAWRRKCINKRLTLWGSFSWFSYTDWCGECYIFLLPEFRFQSPPLRRTYQSVSCLYFSEPYARMVELGAATYPRLASMAMRFPMCRRCLGKWRWWAYQSQRSFITSSVNTHFLFIGRILYNGWNIDLIIEDTTTSFTSRED